VVANMMATENLRGRKFYGPWDWSKYTQADPDIHINNNNNKNNFVIDVNFCVEKLNNMKRSHC
jgi:hypothetical protein